MCAEDRTVPIIDLVHNNATRLPERLQHYLELINYPLKKYATDQAIAEYDAVILRNMQPASMTAQQYADDLVAKLCKVADVFDEGN